MVHHIVMWNFKEEILTEDKPRLKADMEANLKSLVGKVPGLISVEFVKETAPSSTHEIALVTKMERLEDIKVYATHPAHVAAADTYVRPYTCQRACLDYEA